jgi:hypothetical protein
MRVSVVRSSPSIRANSPMRLGPAKVSAAKIENCVARKPWGRK